MMGEKRLKNTKNVMLEICGYICNLHNVSCNSSRPNVLVVFIYVDGLILHLAWVCSLCQKEMGKLPPFGLAYVCVNYASFADKLLVISHVALPGRQRTSMNLFEKGLTLSKEDIFFWT